MRYLKRCKKKRMVKNIKKVKEIRKILKSNFEFFFILVFYFGLYILFWKGKIIFTPDFGQSDSFHINFSYKYFLAENFKKNSFPFWTDYLHNGLPLLGEGQAGGLFFLNILLLKFLPVYSAYSLLLFLNFIIASIGFFLFLKALGIKKKIGLLLSLTLPFTFPFSLRLVHLNALQSYSLLPLLLFLTLSLFKKGGKFNFFLLMITIQQIIAAGNPSASFVVLFTAYIFVLLYALISKKRKQNLKKLFLVMLGFLGGLILALPILIPIYKFSQFTNKFLITDYNYAVSFPYTPKNIPEFIFPFINGNPKTGTYPKFDPENWSTFWENGTYIGFLLGSFSLFFLIYALISLLLIKNKILFTSFLTSFILFLIALGKFSPLYFIFNFPPFLFFRTPGRYLVGAITLFLVFLAKFLTIYTRNKTVYKFFLLILIINLIELIYHTFNYHLWLKPDEIKKPLYALNYIPENSKILVLFTEGEWNKIFLLNGWTSEEEKKGYLFLLNSLYPNSGLIYKRKNFFLNSGGLRSYRLYLAKRLIEKTILEENCNLLLKELKLFKIEFLITPKHISCKNLKLIKTLIHNYKQTVLRINIYKNQSAGKNFFFVPDKIYQVSYLEDLFQFFENSNYELSTEMAIVESNDIKVVKNNLRILSFKKSNNVFVFKVDPDTQGVLIIDQLFTPEWKVFLNEKETRFFRTNLIQTGIYVPKGTRKIEFRYDPIYFKQGIIHAILGSIILIGFTKFFVKEF